MAPPQKESVSKRKRGIGKRLKGYQHGQAVLNHPKRPKGKKRGRGGGGLAKPISKYAPALQAYFLILILGGEGVANFQGVNPCVSLTP